MTPPRRPTYAFDVKGRTVVVEDPEEKKESDCGSIWIKLILHGIYGALIMGMMFMGAFWFMGTPQSIGAYMAIGTASIFGGIISVIIWVTS